jgi:hypothetical protein
MSIRFECPDCGSVLKIKDALAGTEGKCPKCKRPFTVPMASASADAPADMPSTAGHDTSPGSVDAGTVAAPPKSKGRAKIPTPAADDADFDPVAFLMEGGAPPKAKSRAPAPGPSDRGGLSLDDGEPSPEPKPRSKPAEAVRPSAASAAASAGGLLSASSNAKDLLTRTVEESRARAAEMPDESRVPTVDTEQLKMLLFTRILPYGGALIVLCGVLYWIASSMYGTGGVEIPEELIAAEGVVLINDRPAAGVVISMRPMPDSDEPNAKRWRPSTAVTNEDGEFEMMFLEGYPGIVPGRQQVSLSYVVPDFGETINSEYYDPGTMMVIDEDDYDLEIKSTALIPVPREPPPSE